MPITFTCQCGNVLRTADANAGKPGKCPACSTPFVVPYTDGRAMEAPKADVSDYPLRRATRQPVRERGRYDRLTADDVQLRPRLMEEDEEQKLERRRHRLARAEAALEEGDDDRPRVSMRRPIELVTLGLLTMIGSGVWYRLMDARGVTVLQAPLLFVAGAMLLASGVLGYVRRRRQSRWH